MPTLAQNHYGKSRVRLVKVTRTLEAHNIHEWNVGIYLTGPYTNVFSEGDNTGIMATDTMKNSVYACARTSNATTIEAFATELAHFLSTRNPGAETIRITVEEKMWIRLKANEEKHPSAFIQRGPDVATTTVLLSPGTPAVVTSGIQGLVILKTAQSAFHGFHRDELTTLPESNDRLMGTEATIDWLYSSIPQDFAKTRKHIMDTLLTTFATHESLSVQHTLYAMAEAALAAEPAISELTLTMPNRHNIPVNFANFAPPFNTDNPNTIFVPKDEPHGLIHARITR